MLACPQRAEHGYTLFNFDAWRADRRRMFKGAAPDSGCDREFAFGNHWSMNRTVRTNAHFACADQAAFDRDPISNHRVLYAFHAAANSRTRANVQLAPDQDVTDDDLSGLDLEVTVVQKTTGHWRGIIRLKSWCVRADVHAPNFNAGSVQPQKTATGLQAYQRVRRNTSVEIAAEAGGKFAYGMNPAQYPACRAKVNIFFSQDRAKVVFLSANELPPGINVFRKPGFIRQNQIDIGSHQQVGRVALLQGQHQRLVDPAEHNIFFPVGKRAGRRSPGSHAALHGGFEALYISPEAVGKIADLACVLLHHA